ncbi:MAG: LysR family transcriptional regulator [Clostridia bacterium]|nr:LysR family transcriptional regulator [Clostridia bacterium]
MDILYLHEFIVLADIGNYLKAADELFTTQPTLSRHIQALEKDCGVLLFQRTTRKLELTEYGKLLYPYAKEIYAKYTDFEQALDNHKQKSSDQVRIGTLPMMSPYHITDILTGFQARYPNVDLSIMQEDDINLLRQNLCDLIFFRKTDQEYPDIDFVHITSDTLAAIVPIEHPLVQAGRTSVRLSELKDEHFLMLGKHTLLYKMCMNLCIAEGFEPNVVFNGKHADDIITLVKSRMGISLLTKKPIQSLGHNNIVMLDLEPLVETPICIAYLKGKPLSPTVRKFIEYAKDYANEQKDM